MGVMVVIERRFSSVKTARCWNVHPAPARGVDHLRQPHWRDRHFKTLLCVPELAALGGSAGSRGLNRRFAMDARTMEHHRASTRTKD